jgi:hypothetical protein
MDDDDIQESEQTKDLDYLMLHPEEFPEDPADVEGVEDKTEDSTLPTIDLRPQKEKEPQAEPVAEETPQPKPTDPIEEKLPVATKDGQSTIPFGVLADVRNKAKEAEARVAKLEQELEAERARKSEPEPEPSASPEPEEDEPNWETMASEYPEDVIKVMQSAWRKAQNAEADAKAAREEAARFRAAEETQIRDDSQDAIDRNESLVAWQANDPKAWQQAVEVDRMLAGQDEWKTKSLDERFVKVVEVVKAMNPTATPPAETPEQTDAKARAALEKAGPTGPTSLSDIPGGSPPPQNELEILENVSNTQLAAKLEAMDPNKLEEYLTSQGV